MSEPGGPQRNLVDFSSQLQHRLSQEKINHTLQKCAFTAKTTKICGPSTPLSVSFPYSSLLSQQQLCTFLLRVNLPLARRPVLQE